MKMAHISEKQMGLYSALPYILGVIANLVGGVVFDRVTVRRGICFAGRLIGGGSLFCCAALMLTMTQLRGQAAIVIVSALGFGICDFMLPAAWAVAMNMGGRRAGTVTGAMNTAGQIGGFVCAVLVGNLVQTTNSYNAPVIVVALVVGVAAATFCRIDGSQRIFNEALLED
jgi:MFS family permease